MGFPDEPRNRARWEMDEMKQERLKEMKKKMGDTKELIRLVRHQDFVVEILEHPDEVSERIWKVATDLWKQRVADG